MITNLATNKLRIWRSNVITSSSFTPGWEREVIGLSLNSLCLCWPIGWADKEDVFCHPINHQWHGVRVQLVWNARLHGLLPWAFTKGFVSEGAEFQPAVVNRGGWIAFHFNDVAIRWNDRQACQRLNGVRKGVSQLTAAAIVNSQLERWTIVFRDRDNVLIRYCCVARCVIDLFS